MIQPARSLLLLTCTLGLAACSTPSITGGLRGDDGGDGGSAAPADSYAGTWTREDNGAEFTVTDDGQTVHGELTGGDAEYRSYFTAYTFDLKRAGDGLKGEAEFAFADDPDNALHTAWAVTREGDKLRGELEWITFKDDGSEDERGTDVKTFRFDPAAAPAAPAYTPPAIDMSAHVPVSPTYKHLLFDGMAVGQWSETETAAAGQTYVTRTAVVGDAGDAWILEFDNQMNQKDLLLAVFVDKATGKTLQAFVGNRAKEGKAKDVPAMPAGAGGEEDEGTRVRAKTPAGVFVARRYDRGDTKTWIGEDDEVKGVMLMIHSPTYQDQLLSLETGKTYEAGDLSFPATVLTYKNSGEQWRASGETPYFNAPLQMKNAGGTTRLVGQGDGAEPAFDYPR